MTDEPLTYADSGVDIADSEAATGALVSALADLDTDDFAGVLDIGDRYLALATDGVGTKLLVADAVDDYSTIGIDCIAMNANDLVAMGVEPIGFVDYLAVDRPSESLAAEIGEGLAEGANQANLALLGGETAVLPEIVTGFDLAGACVGIAEKGELLASQAEPGDALIGFPSSGIHSNGLTLARKAIERHHAYSDPMPDDRSQTIGEALLEPTKLYTDLLPLLREYPVRGAAHITGGGFTNLRRLGEHRYNIRNPLPAQSIFDVIQSAGSVTDEEMHRTFNMGTGFVLAVPDDSAEKIVAESNGQIIGEVIKGDAIQVRGCSL